MLDDKMLDALDWGENKKIRGLVTAEVLKAWSADADALVEICGCTKKEALYAIFQQREIELKTNLHPLIEALKPFWWVDDNTEEDNE